MSEKCKMCDGHRWIRIQGSAAAAYGHDELKAVCPACNTKGEYDTEPDDWSSVPVVGGTAVRAAPETLDLSKSYVTAIWWHEARHFAIMLRKADQSWLVLLMAEDRQTALTGEPRVSEQEMLAKMREIFCEGLFPHHEILLQTDDAERIQAAVMSVPFIEPALTGQGGRA